MDFEAEPDETPNGIRYSKGQDPFYLMHENQLMSLLRRAHNGEGPDDLLMENWVNTQVMNADDEDAQDNLELGDNDTAVILVDLEEDD